MTRLTLFCALTIAATMLGCSKSNDQSAPQTAAPQPVAPPDVAVREFLEAIRTGDDKKAETMLTDTAKQKTLQADLMVAPPGSPTAHYELREMEVIEDQVAHVGCVWTDVGDDGKPQSNEFIWALRRQPQGWRIAGVAVQLFPDQPPLLLDFEDPADMQRKQQMAEAEMQRRMNQQSQAQPGATAGPGPGTIQPTAGMTQPGTAPGTQIGTVAPSFQPSGPANLGANQATATPGTASPANFNPYAPSPIPSQTPSVPSVPPLQAEQPGLVPR